MKAFLYRLTLFIVSIGIAIIAASAFIIDALIFLFTKNSFSISTVANKELNVLAQYLYDKGRK